MDRFEAEPQYDPRKLRAAQAASRPSLGDEVSRNRDGAVWAQLTGTDEALNKLESLVHALATRLLPVRQPAPQPGRAEDNRKIATPVDAWPVVDRLDAQRTRINTLSEISAQILDDLQI